MKHAGFPWTMMLVAVIGCGGSTARGGSKVGHAGTGAAAGSTGGASADAGATGTISTWVTDLIAAYCTWAVRCGKYRDAATCKAFDGPQIDVVNFDQGPAAVTAVLDGMAQFDPTQAASCLSAISDLTCDFDFVNPPSMPEPCLAAFSGNVSDGDACVDEVACAKGSVCVKSIIACEGLCKPASGGSCRTNADCGPEQYCAVGFRQGSGLWGTGVCEAFVPPGASAGDLIGTPVPCAPGLSSIGGPAPARCGAAAEAGERCGGFVGPSCAPGLACVPSDDGTKSTCMIPAKLGEPCTSLFQCGAQYELSDIICDETDTHACVRKPSTGPCVLAGTLNICDPVTSFCNTFVNGGTCQPLLSQGAQCGAIYGNPCGPWNQCQNGVCVPELGVCKPE